MDLQGTHISETPPRCFFHTSQISGSATSGGSPRSSRLVNDHLWWGFLCWNPVLGFPPQVHCKTMWLRCWSAPHLLDLGKIGAKHNVCDTVWGLHSPTLDAESALELPLLFSTLNPGDKLLLEASSASPDMGVLTTQLLLLSGMPGTAWGQSIGAIWDPC